MHKGGRAKTAPERRVGDTADGADIPAMRFDLAELETFLAVARLGSFSLAAKQLHVSQPSVTSRIQRLEGTLKVKLLIRTTRRVEPTAEGARLRDAAERALSELREVLRDFQSAAEADRRRVVVAATPMVAAFALPAIIRSYCQRYTDVEIRLLDLPYDQLLLSIEAGTADLAVTVFDGAPGKFRFQFLTDEEMRLVVPAAHPLAGLKKVTIDEFAPYPLMILARYTTLRAQLAAEYARRGLSFRPVDAANLATLLGMVDAGMGITFLPRAMAQSNARRNRVALRLADVALSRRYGIVTVRKASLGPAAQSFCRYVAEEFEKSFAAMHDADG